MKKIIVFFAYIFLLTTIAPVALAAQGKVVTSASGIKFATGGIGDEEVQTMRAIAKQFSLNLVFSEGEGGRITGVNAVIFNEQGESVFYIKGANPLLYVDLPSGDYRIIANYNGAKQGVVFNLAKGKNKKLILNWKEAE